METWRTLLQARLREIRPDSVCALDPAAHGLAAEVLPHATLRLHGTPPSQPCAVAIGIDALNGLDAQQARQLISHARLYAAPRLLVVAHPDCALDETAFRALGFMLYGNDAAANVRLYDYDLDTYKTVPDWLNARFWANPERWEP